MTPSVLTFQEASPLITYSPGWFEGSLKAAARESSYNGTFRNTSTDGATASFKFTGTAVSIFGSTQPTHGNYSVTLDQRPPFLRSGTTLQFRPNRTLWSAPEDLLNTEHTVTLTNKPVAQTNRTFLDLDYVLITRQIGNVGDEISQDTIDDDDSSAVEYLPAEKWTKINRDTANAGSLHMTNVADSQVSITFNGCCVEIYGDYANAAYSVVLDNSPPVKMHGFDIDPTSDSQHPRTLLYLADALDRNHTVTLTNTNSNANRPFFFDYAIVSRAKKGNMGGSTGSNRIPAIVGAVVGSVTLFLALFVLLFFLIRRRRRQRARQAELDFDQSELAPKPYILHDQNNDSARAHQHLTSLGDPHPLQKRRQMANNQGTSPSTEGLLTSQGQSSDESSESPGAAFPTASRNSPARQKDTRKHAPRSHTTVGENPRHPAVQEEDVGAVIGPEGQPATLPPAYNPEWHRGEDS